MKEVNIATDHNHFIQHTKYVQVFITGVWNEVADIVAHNNLQNIANIIIKYFKMVDVDVPQV